MKCQAIRAMPKLAKSILNEGRQVLYDNVLTHVPPAVEGALLAKVTTSAYSRLKRKLSPALRFLWLPIFRRHRIMIKKLIRVDFFVGGIGSRPILTALFVSVVGC